MPQTQLDLARALSIQWPTPSRDGPRGTPAAVDRYSVEMGRGDAVAATWKIRGDEPRRRRSASTDRLARSEAAIAPQGPTSRISGSLAAQRIHLPPRRPLAPRDLDRPTCILAKQHDSQTVRGRRGCRRRPLGTASYRGRGLEPRAEEPRPAQNEIGRRGAARRPRPPAAAAVADERLWVPVETKLNI